MAVRPRTLLTLLAFLALTAVLAAVMIAAALLFGMRPQTVFAPGHAAQAWLESRGMQPHHRLGVLFTVAVWWVAIVAVWMLVRRLVLRLRLRRG
jgi:hypothetical protein